MAYQYWAVITLVCACCFSFVLWRQHVLETELMKMRERTGHRLDEVGRDLEVFKDGLDIDAAELDTMKRSVADMSSLQTGVDRRLSDLTVDVDRAQDRLVSITGEIIEIRTLLQARMVADKQDADRNREANDAFIIQIRRLASAVDGLAARLAEQGQKLAETENAISKIFAYNINGMMQRLDRTASTSQIEEVAAALSELSVRVEEQFRVTASIDQVADLDAAIANRPTAAQLEELEISLVSSISSSMQEVTSMLSGEMQLVVTPRLNALDEGLASLQDNLAESIATAIRVSTAEAVAAEQRARTIDLADRLDRLISDPIERRRIELSSLPSMRAIDSSK